MPLFQWNTNPFANLSLDSNGLIALADLGTIAQRTALTGGASFLDTFLLCPGIHRQQTATELNKGEYVLTCYHTPSNSIGALQFYSPYCTVR